VHNDELHNLYASPDITRAIKLKSIGWAGHRARTWRWKMRTQFYSVNVKKS